MHEDIKSRINSGNACHHSVQSLLFSRLLYTNVKVKIDTTIILPVVSCGCETWSLTLREQHRLRVFGNKVLGRIFGHTRDDVKREWKNVGLHNLFSSPDIIRQIKSKRMRWTWHVARMREEKKVYKVLVRNPEKKRQLGGPNGRWDGTKMDLRETGWRVWGGFTWLGVRDRWRTLMNM
jgi:hypothetical protein